MSNDGHKADPEQDVSLERGEVLRRSSSGMTWTSASFLVGKAASLATTIVLAKMLQPEVFGLMSFALVWIGALAVFRDMEVGSALIYRKNHIKKAANAAFFLSILTGIALTSLAMSLAPLAALYFQHPQVEPIMRALSVTFLIYSFGSTHAALIQRDLAFRKRNIQEEAPSLVTLDVPIPSVSLGGRVWSLVTR